MNGDCGELAAAVTRPEFDRVALAAQIIEDEGLRGQAVRLMLDHAEIAVYYACYEAVELASRSHPRLFYPDWDRFAGLLEHPNSYHRDFGLTLLANLCPVDQDGRFEALVDAYFIHLHDEKFMTARCCVRNAIKIARVKPALRGAILATLLNVEAGCAYAENQLALLKGDVLVFIEAIHDLEGCSQADAFIRAQVESTSPRTRRLARELVRKFQLS